jgi:hypothetical protein
MSSETPVLVIVKALLCHDGHTNGFSNRGLTLVASNDTFAGTAWDLTIWIYMVSTSVGEMNVINRIFNLFMTQHRCDGKRYERYE